MIDIAKWFSKMRPQFILLPEIYVISDNLIQILLCFCCVLPVVFSHSFPLFSTYFFLSQTMNFHSRSPSSLSSPFLSLPHPLFFFLSLFYLCFVFYVLVFLLRCFSISLCLNFHLFIKWLCWVPFPMFIGHWNPCLCEGPVKYFVIFFFG